MKTFLHFALFFLLGQVIYATNYYCDPLNGNLNNDGSKENPWGTLESVFANNITFKTGDEIFLLSGNHGDVNITGVNEKYISIVGYENHNPVINSLVFGTDKLSASRWTITNVFFKSETNPKTVFIHQNSTKIRLLENNFVADNINHIAIDISGTQCKIENNVISNYKNGIQISGSKNQIRNNRIEFFSNNGIEVFGDYNVLEYNLIKESIETDLDINNGIFLSSNPIKGNFFRGNVIINFIKPNRKHIGVLNGIYGINTVISESVFENNVVISNGKNGIYLKGEMSNLKIVNNTIVNPYFGLSFKENDEINTPLTIKLLGENNSSNLIIRNNLSNDVLFDNIKGIADHNLTIPVSVHDFDRNFNNWALFDFSLNKTSKALNAGTSEMAPKLDATLNSRSLGNFINIGAYEYAKIDESNESLKIPSEISDRQIHSKGKGDWDGQPQIRIGGVGENIDGAGVFAFKLPIIPQGKKVISANFKVNLSKIDNQPQGGIDLYGLTPKTNFWVTEDMYYQGTYGQDLTARPIQNNVVESDTYSGENGLSSTGKVELKNYLNTVIESGSNSEGYIFLRMNPNSDDVTDYHRWNFISANSDEKENHPKLELVLGYPALNTTSLTKTTLINNAVIASSNPISCGDVSFYFIGFDSNKMVQLRLLNLSGDQVFNHSLKTSKLSDGVFRTENLGLSTGKYFLEYLIDDQSKKQILFVW